MSDPEESANRVERDVPHPILFTIRGEGEADAGEVFVSGDESAERLRTEIFRGFDFNRHDSIQREIYMRIAPFFSPIGELREHCNIFLNELQRQTYIFPDELYWQVYIFQDELFRKLDEIKR